MSTIKSTKLASLGRTTAVKTFTRDNNFSVVSRNARQAQTKRISTNQSCVVWVKQRLTLAFALVLAFLAFSTASAQAETQGPVWRIIAASNPTNFKPGVKPGIDTIVVEAVNVGGASTNGSPVTISDSLPAGLTATESQLLPHQGYYRGVTGVDTYRKPFTFFLSVGSQSSNMQCSPTPTRVASCTESSRVGPGDTLIVEIPVSVEVGAGGAESLTSVATVSGGGAASASASAPVTIDAGAPSYGVARGGLLAASSMSQAGAHANVTMAFFLNTVNMPDAFGEEFAGLAVAAGEPKDIGFDLPPGLVGNTVGMPRCAMAEVANESNCPRDTMVGTSTVIINSTDGGLGRLDITAPVFNIAPAPLGEPAAFAFNTVYFPVRLDTSVLSDGDYGVRVSATDINQAASVNADLITIWGVPADHNGPGPDSTLVFGVSDTENENGSGETAGWRSFGGTGVKVTNAGVTTTQSRVPLLTNSSQCSTPLEGIVSTDSWAALGAFAEQPTSMVRSRVIACFLQAVGLSARHAGSARPSRVIRRIRGRPQNTETEGLATPDVKTSCDFAVGDGGFAVDRGWPWGLFECAVLRAGVRAKRRPRSPGNARATRRSGRCG